MQHLIRPIERLQNWGCTKKRKARAVAIYAQVDGSWFLNTLGHDAALSPGFTLKIHGSQAIFEHE